MTHAQAVLLVTPVSITLATGGLLMMLWLALHEVYPQHPQPVPVYFVNGTVSQLADAIARAAPPAGKRIGLVDADGYLVVYGTRYMQVLKEYAGCYIVAIRGEYKEEQ